MSKQPTAREVYNAMGVLDRAGILDSLSPRVRMSNNTFTGNDAEFALNVTFDNAMDKGRKKWRRMTRENVDDAVALYNNEKMTYAAIGRKLGFSQTSIKRNIMS